MIYIADSYNHKIKRLDPATGSVETLFGTGRPGTSDGRFDKAELWEPEGVVFAGTRLYLADTNNHLVRVADLEARTLHTLTLHGLERLSTGPREDRRVVRLPAVEVGAGDVSFVFSARLPRGYKLNPEAPAVLREAPDGAAYSFAPGEPPRVTTRVMADREMELDLTLYPCEVKDERLCLIHDVRLAIPLSIVDGGPTEVPIIYDVSIP
jgi:hypothetical protein